MHFPIASTWKQIYGVPQKYKAVHKPRGSINVYMCNKNEWFRLFPLSESNEERHCNNNVVAVQYYSMQCCHVWINSTIDSQYISIVTLLVMIRQKLCNQHLLYITSAVCLTRSCETRVCVQNVPTLFGSRSVSATPDRTKSTRALNLFILLCIFFCFFLTCLCLLQLFLSK